MASTAIQSLRRFALCGHELLHPTPDDRSSSVSRFAGRGLRLRWLMAYVVLGGLAYGGVMGAFGGFAGQRLLQVCFSAVKVPMLIIASFALTLPSFFVLNTLLGLRRDFPQALRAVIAGQAALAIVLAALSPYTAVWYLTSGHYRHATLFNGLMFAIACFAAQWPLRRRYAPLIARQPRHRLMLRAWLFVYIFVAIQMAWILRPFIGDPERPTVFFRDEAWGNAYLVVGEIIIDSIARLFSDR